MYHFLLRESITLDDVSRVLYSFQVQMLVGRGHGSVAGRGSHRHGRLGHRRHVYRVTESPWSSTWPGSHLLQRSSTVRTETALVAYFIFQRIADHQNVPAVQGN